MKPETLPTLKAFQKWRLGETAEMPGDAASSPKQFPGALDDAIAELEKISAPIPEENDTCKADWGGRKADCPHWQHGCCINDCENPK